MRLHEVAHARAGDKGNDSCISVILFDPDRYDALARVLTAARVAEHFAPILDGPVERYEVPAIGALNFVLRRSLGGGVTRSLRLDRHGKTLSGVMLAIELDLPG
ncbi:AtuA-related protein [Pseudodonghicola flavimaris]|uniref:AtuA-like ferredoxin-fold domain-containing protein n=1 Tax=Pseudodonghicola flavimaris TaxID=3050036 RepID=A0ABT7F513_9RHOB|nr:hypothetical protein [Pseudodonghicola flavimaris]MDK3019702.1 hypothetical protein [Pseudodonghicola flavimaris]